MQTKHIVCPDCLTINRVHKQKLQDQPKCDACSHALFLGASLNLTSNAFQRHISHNDIPVLVYFWAAWCGPCKQMKAIYEQLVSGFEPNIRMLRINTEKVQNIAAQYYISSVPTLILFKDGKEINRHCGAMSKADLRRWINCHTARYKQDA